jgi:hypothetical protein
MQAVEVVARSLYGTIKKPACVVVQLKLIKSKPKKTL